MSLLRSIRHNSRNQTTPQSLASPLGLSGASIGRVSALVIPADLMTCAWRSLFPAERLVFLGGRRTHSATRHVSSAWDVTGDNRSIVHVRSSAELLSRALLDFEATQARVYAWLHSHPGFTAMATHPSTIDWDQDATLRRDFGPLVVGFVATVDGYLRVWGRSIDDDLIRVEFEGGGIVPVAGEAHVYRFALR